MDHDYRKTAAEVGFTVDKTKGDDLAKFPIEVARLRSIGYYISISTICTIGYGWTLQARAVRCENTSLDGKKLTPVAAPDGPLDPSIHLRSHRDGHVQCKRTE